MASTCGSGVSVDGPASRSLHVDGCFPVFPQEDAIWSDAPTGGGLAQLGIPVSIWEGRDHNPGMLMEDRNYNHSILIGS